MMTPNTVLPPLPEPSFSLDGGTLQCFSIEQLREYAIAALALRPGGEPSDEQILHRWDTHVGDPTARHPLGDADKINFARAVLALRPVGGAGRDANKKAATYEAAASFGSSGATAIVKSLLGTPDSTSGKPIDVVVEWVRDNYRGCNLAALCGGIRSAYRTAVAVGGADMPAEWQPIETAPKDVFLLLSAEFDGPGDWRIKMGEFRTKSSEPGWNLMGASWAPTRWMPLPPAPKEQS